MKRTPLRRKTRLAQGKPIKRTARLRNGCRIKPVNRKRKASRFARNYGSSERAQWVNSHPCICGGQHPACAGRTVNAHLVSKAHRGTAADVVPLSDGCHTEQHQHGWVRWCDLAGLTLDEVRAIADEMATRGPDAPG